MPTVLDCALLAQQSYRQNDPSTVIEGWRAVSILNNPNGAGTGISGACVLQIWQRGSEYIVAVRGTDPGNTKDLRADLKIGVPGLGLGGYKHDRAITASRATTPVLNGLINETTPITFTGHSLGGNMAQYLAREQGAARCRFVTFNAPGSNAEAWRDAEKFGVNVCDKSDLVRKTGGKNLGVKYLMQGKYGKINFLKAHSMDNILACLRDDEIAHRTVDDAIVHALRQHQTQ